MMHPRATRTTGSRDMHIREIDRIINAIATSDGAGVSLRRSLGQTQAMRVDPFLMLDEFGSDQPDDYLPGFPPHPHRGFETVTYMLEGRMLHEDHLGNRGELDPGGAQWMTAGRGIVHSEMPRQSEGRLHGFQLWVNLPAAEKMQPASYRDIGPEEIPEAPLPGGGVARVLAGTLDVDGEAVTGPVTGKSTAPLYFDLHLTPSETLVVPVSDGLNGFVYVYDGIALAGSEQASTKLEAGQAGVLGNGDSVRVVAGEHGARVLLIAGKPIGEPIVQHGPFVMNTSAEIDRAMSDYRDGTLTD